MTNGIHTNPEKRHDFVLLFDVTDGNPNGDPDAGNLPRVDPETMQGLVTDVCLKRKVRDWVEIARASDPRYKIYVQHESYLTESRARVFSARGNGRGDTPPPSEARRWMCEEFFDIRMFGAVMSMKAHNAGQVRGPAQLTFARSLDPITPLDTSITRVALERGEPSANPEDEIAVPTHGTMGRKSIVPYGLYMDYGFFSPHFARDTGASEQDLETLWQALVNMWDMDRSSSRGMMACRGLYVFTHDSPLGNAPAHTLFERVKAEKKPGIEVPRRFSDYVVTASEENMPNGVTLTRLAG